MDRAGKRTQVGCGWLWLAVRGRRAQHSVWLCGVLGGLGGVWHSPGVTLNDLGESPKGCQPSSSSRTTCSLPFDSATLCLWLLVHREDFSQTDIRLTRHLPLSLSAHRRAPRLRSLALQVGFLLGNLPGYPYRDAGQRPAHLLSHQLA